MAASARHRRAPRRATARRCLAATPQHPGGHRDRCRINLRIGQTARCSRAIRHIASGSPVASAAARSVSPASSSAGSRAPGSRFKSAGPAASAPGPMAQGTPARRRSLDVGAETCPAALSRHRAHGRLDARPARGQPRGAQLGRRSSGATAPRPGPEALADAEELQVAWHPIHRYANSRVEGDHG
jgi:hypothetical protein